MSCRTSPVAVADRLKFSCRILAPVAAMTFAGVVVSDEVMLGGDWGGAATAPRGGTARTMGVRGGLGIADAAQRGGAATVPHVETVRTQGFRLCGGDAIAAETRFASAESIFAISVILTIGLKLTLRPALEDGLGTILSHLSKKTRTVRRPKPGVCTPLRAGPGTRRDAVRRDALKTGVRSSRRLAAALHCPPSVVHPSVADATGIERAASRALLLATMNVSGMALTRRSERRAILPPEYFIPEASIMNFAGHFLYRRSEKKMLKRKLGDLKERGESPPSSDTTAVRELP
ncbi:hypothetical protein KPH14_000764 [Odynerus spinipes]|uniref:Uncharacterized protein n=1 Tax=Odynerus spinipes TaxID=1348599 RepID=A0AAD9RDM6_9HYME|nr:hypothetical protein KPH14_000764 [Odynerus spinipes]